MSNIEVPKHRTDVKLTFKLFEKWNNLQLNVGDK